MLLVTNPKRLTLNISADLKDISIMSAVRIYKKKTDGSL